MSEFERQIRRRRQREREVHRADRAVGIYIAWIVGGMIALIVALVVFDSAPVAIIIGAVVAVVVLWRLLMRSQR